MWMHTFLQFVGIRISNLCNYYLQQQLTCVPQDLPKWAGFLPTVVAS